MSSYSTRGAIWALGQLLQACFAYIQHVSGLWLAASILRQETLNHLIVSGDRVAMITVVLLGLQRPLAGLLCRITREG